MSVTLVGGGWRELARDHVFSNASRGSEYGPIGEAERDKQGLARDRLGHVLELRGAFLASASLRRRLRNGIFP